MTQEDKQLLLKDLCARLPYKVIVEIISYGQETQKPWFGELSCKSLDCFLHDVAYKSIKPYLRPLSSMTEEESAEVSNIISEWFDKELFYLTEEPFLEYALQMIDCTINPMLFDWLNKKMFDYRGLIPKGLAIEVTKDNNPYNINKEIEL